MGRHASSITNKNTAKSQRSAQVATVHSVFILAWSDACRVHLQMPGLPDPKIASFHARASRYKEAANKPESNWQTTNHGQLILSFNAGFNTFNVVATRPLQITGIRIPAQNGAYFGNIGNITAYKTPTKIEMVM